MRWVVGLVFSVATSLALPVSETVGATAWGACYNLNFSRCGLLDGADAIARTGSTAIKLNVADPAKAYKWGPCEWPKQGFANMVDAVKHPAFQEVLRQPRWRTVTLVAFAPEPPNANKTLPGAYWRSSFDDEAFAWVSSHFEALARYLLTAPELPAGERTYVLQNWEGDWASRAQYNASQPAPQTVLAHMQRWAAARQAGVDAARKAVPASAARSVVLNALEVNLVKNSIVEGQRNVVTAVLPGVALDMVSYSSYDCQQRLQSGQPPSLQDCLTFIHNHHNRTTDSPDAAVYLGEYGLPQNLAPPSLVASTLDNVLAAVQQLSFVRGSFLWEVFCNTPKPSDEDDAQALSVRPWQHGHALAPQPRCTTKPVTNASALEGFWLFLPDGTPSQAFYRLQKEIDGATET